MSLLIDGTAKSDVLIGTSTGDTINAGAGNDVVAAGNGNDTVYGGDGNDRLYGDNGSDTLRGDDGNDRLYGDDGDDLLYGDSGNDWLWGGMGDDVLNGDTGHDALFGEDGNDVLNAGTGDDRLDGGAGNDILRGEGGDDLLIVSEGNDILDGGEGIDTISCAKIIGKAIIDLGVFTDAGQLILKPADAPPGSPPSETSTLYGIDNVVGSQFDDEMNGNLSQNRLDGGEGNDYLIAVGDGDTLVGGSGSDIFNFFPSLSSNPVEEAWVADFNAAEGDKFDLSGLGVVSSGPFDEYASIDNLPGESIITIIGKGQLFHIGEYIIHVSLPSLQSPGLQLSDFILN